MADQTDEVVLVVELEPAPGCHDEIVRILQRNAARVVRSRVGCRSYVVRDAGPEESIVLIGKWDTERQLRDHLRSPTAAAGLESLVGMLAAPPVPRILEPRPT